MSVAELGEFTIHVGQRACTVQHRRALVTWLDEQRYLGEGDTKQYGLVLWPASIALGLEIAERAQEFRGTKVLELGAGVGLAGIVAAACGASVVQTDRDEEALAMCRRNAEQSGVVTDTRVGDWSEWTDDARYDWVIASDVLYRTTLHAQLRAVFDRTRAPRGRLLIADPLRKASVEWLEGMEREGWDVSMTRYTIGEGEWARPIGVFELSQSN